MENRDLEELGDRIQNLIDNAVNSQDYQKLSQNITKAVEKAVQSGNTAWKNVTRSSNQTGNASFRNGRNPNDQMGQNFQPNYKQYRYVPPQEFQRKQQTSAQEAPQYPASAVYTETSGKRTKAVLMVIGGAILAAVGGLHLLTAGIVGAVLHPGEIHVTLTTWISLLGGAGLLTAGIRGNSRITRFQQYVKAIGNAAYVNVDRLAAAVRKPRNYVKKDLKKLIDKGWFVEGHLDRKETCLITNNEMYQLYEESERQLEERQREEEKKQEVIRKKEEQAAPKNQMSKEVQEIWDKGHEYLKQIHQNNLNIPGVEISAKISHMEELVKKILEGTKEHPENAADLKKLMNYYLPMTIKLLDVYEEMDRQPVQGENICKSKKEIEETMDTLNDAFEKMLDSIFQETAIDVSSDISVLNTMLAQEGYAEDEIQRAVRK